MLVSDLVLTHKSPKSSRLAAPLYNGNKASGIALAVESMKRHTTDEGWQIMQGLEHSGYQLCGYNLPTDNTCTSCILKEHDPGVVVVQDKREWDVTEKNFRENEARFYNVHLLAKRADIFKLTILKDAHQRDEYHRQSAAEMGVHAWITYYHPKMVCHLAPYVRPQHLIRTYHSLDRELVPAYTHEQRRGALLSGAMSGAYPWRMFLKKKLGKLPQVTHLSHPGYHMNGTATPKFLKQLGSYRVAICTSSIYGYVLRKMIEATACGCIVLTDLPEDEILPGIDENIIRIAPTRNVTAVSQMLSQLYKNYDPDKQKALADKAKQMYDYRVLGAKLVNDIENLRSDYDERT